MDIVTALSGLAAILDIASSVKDLMSSQKLSKEKALDDVRRQSGQDVRDLLDNSDVAASILQMMIISPKLLRQLNDEAHKCEQKHIDARKKAKKESEIDQANIDAAGCMCRVLRDIKRYNNDVLPGPPFDDWWTSYRCRD